MSLKQDNRSIGIKTALKLNTLALRSFSLREQLSRPFQIEAQLSSEDADIDFDKVVGHDVTIWMNVAQNAKRFFHGYVSRLVQVADQSGYAHYNATIVPWLWFLTRTSDCRIFQEKSVPDIIEAVFKDRGFSDYQLKLSGNYSPKEYCVQYRETDFNFVSRLMEQEGIYYFFVHEDGKDTLALADSISAHKPFAGYENISFNPAQRAAPTLESIAEWTVEKELQPVASALQDFDFKKPKTSLLVTNNVTRNYGKAEYEIYDYPGAYVEHSDGQRLADVRLEELQTQYEILNGRAHARGMAAGSIFKLKNHPRSDQNRDYLITGVSLQADAGEFASTGASAQEFFSCSFSCIDKSQQFRPARLTPKPIVQGPQTAIVTGPAGEDIYPDEYARVKVQFPWDRLGKNDENSSCWIRVSQSWAGKQWGDMAIPHVGHEVIVSFLEGNPDRPIITGRVYNQANMPPMDIDTHKYKRILDDNYGNRIVFSAKPGDEHIRIYSPHHKSGATYGHSAWNWAESNVCSATLGDGLTCAIGTTLAAVLGGAFQQVVGLSFGGVLGESFTGTVGPATQLNLGPQMQASAGWKYQTNGSDSYNLYDGNVLWAAKGTMSIVGGEGKKNKNTSLMKADANNIELSMGAPLDAQDTEFENPILAKTFLTISVVLPVAAVVVGACAATSVSALNPSPTDDTDQALSSSQEGFEVAAGVLEALGLICSIISVKAMAEKADASKHPSHAANNDHQARILLNKDGTASFDAKTSIVLGITDKDAMITMDENELKMAHEGTGKAIVKAGTAQIEVANTGNITISGKVSIKGSLDVNGGTVTVQGPPVPAPPKLIRAKAQMKKSIVQLKANHATLTAKTKLTKAKQFPKNP
jgi:type VI secretion system secreted protein VgrG